MKYSICLEGEVENMSTVTGTFSLQVNAANANPLTITPASGTLNAETEGVNEPGQVVANVSGGTAPYTFEATGMPDGMDLRQQPGADGGSDVDIVIEGTPTAGDAANSPFSIVITATDSAPTPAQAKRLLVVKR